MVDVNIPDVQAELEAAFACYEAALMANDIETLTGCSGTVRSRCATA